MTTSGQAPHAGAESAMSILESQIQALNGSSEQIVQAQNVHSQALSSIAGGVQVVQAQNVQTQAAISEVARGMNYLDEHVINTLEEVEVVRVQTRQPRWWHVLAGVIAGIIATIVVAMQDFTTVVETANETVITTAPAMDVWWIGPLACGILVALVVILILWGINYLFDRSMLIDGQADRQRGLVCPSYPPLPPRDIIEAEVVTESEDDTTPQISDGGCTPPPPTGSPIAIAATAVTVVAPQPQVVEADKTPCPPDNPPKDDSGVDKVADLPVVETDKMPCPPDNPPKDDSGIDKVADVMVVEAVTETDKMPCPPDNPPKDDSGVDKVVADEVTTVEVAKKPKKQPAKRVVAKKATAKPAAKTTKDDTKTVTKTIKKTIKKTTKAKKAKVEKVTKIVEENDGEDEIFIKNAPQKDGKKLIAKSDKKKKVAVSAAKPKKASAAIGGGEE